nr:hypothetical protein [Tanacetum cinerariifolium]
MFTFFNLPARAELVLEAEELLLPLARAEEGSFIMIPFKVLALNVDFDFKINFIVFGPETSSTPVSFSSGGSGCYKLKIHPLNHNQSLKSQRQQLNEETAKDKGPACEVSSLINTKGRTVAITAKDMQKMKNDVKARTTLLLALPGEHQNEATKKTKKNQLKQQYGNFKAEGSETLEQTFNSGKSEVPTIQRASTASVQVPTVSTNVAAASLSYDTVCAFIATQPNGSQIKYEEIYQIDDDDIDEMDIKWNLALLSMRADRFWKKIGKKITIQGSDVAGFDKSKVECFNCHKMGHFVRECRSPRSQDRGKRESYKKNLNVEELAPKAMIAIDGIG